MPNISIEEYVCRRPASSQWPPYPNKKNRIFTCILRWKCFNACPNSKPIFTGLSTNNWQNSDFNHSFHFVHLHSDFLHEWSWHSRDVLSTRMDFSPTKYYRAVRPPLALQRCIIHTNGFYTSKIQGRAANAVGNTLDIYYTHLRILHVQYIWPYGHIWHVQMKNNKTQSE